MIDSEKEKPSNVGGGQIVRNDERWDGSIVRSQALEGLVANLRTWSPFFSNNTPWFLQQETLLGSGSSVQGAPCGVRSTWEVDLEAT